ncbi:MAG: hypothetical protein QOE70_5559 [Chthoniobacter sp.]|jgi:thymidylate kinase|nr:hypothetical protein [Chthoniobacter sp.]
MNSALDVPDRRPASIAPGPRIFFGEFFHELEQRGIPYVVLHGYQDFPDEFTSDVDYAVAQADLPKIGPLLCDLASAHGWVVAQTIQREVSGFYSVVIDPASPVDYLLLDVCSHFTKGGRLLVRDAVLLEGRRRCERGFFVPATESEFIYVLAKGLANHKPGAEFVPQLRDLWSSDAQGAQRRFSELLGETGRTLAEWFREPPEAWEALAGRLRGRSRYGLALRVAEGLRIVRRALHPPGLHIAVLGPDGAGKSTLLANLRALLAPCFGQQRVFKFRPDVFGRIESGINQQPHARSPRSRAVSWVKILYYFADWWLGWLLILAPARLRNALVVFDRDFDDIVVDQRRYLLQGVGKLARFLRWLLPRADLTFILDADAGAVHVRKPELPVEVIERQRSMYRRLAATGASYWLISADQSPGEVAHAVAREIITLLGAREQLRRQRGRI